MHVSIWTICTSSPYMVFSPFCSHSSRFRSKILALKSDLTMNSIISPGNWWEMQSLRPHSSNMCFNNIPGDCDAHSSLRITAWDPSIPSRTPSQGARPVLLSIKRNFILLRIPRSHYCYLKDADTESLIYWKKLIWTCVFIPKSILLTTVL